MIKYKYQMHMHTFPCSACAKVSPEEMADILKKGGFQGGVITNHFKGGNTGIDRKLPWAEFVKAYEDDYIAFKEAGEKLDLDIHFGIEQGVGGGREILVYGITPEMLYNHPELDTMNPEIWYKTLKQYNVLIYQAHPFRDRDYIKEIGVMQNFIDGIEIYNYCNTQLNNMEAEEYVENHKEILLVSGGDAHGEYGACNGGIETAKRLKTQDDVVNVLKCGAFNLIKE